MKLKEEKMKTILELAADTQAAIDEIKANCGDPCHPHGSDTCRSCWDMDTDMARLMRLYHEHKTMT